MRIETASSGSSRPSSRRISAQLGPSTNSITMYWRPVDSSEPKSNTWTMFGCTSRAAASASRRKRETKLESARQVLGQQLDGHVALQPRVERELHGGHAADAEPAFEAVAVCEERVGGHPSSGGTPPVPGWFLWRRRRRRVPGSTVDRRRPAWPSASGVSVGVGRLASASRSGVGVGSGVGVFSGSGALHSVGDPAVEVVQPVAQVRLEPLVGPARQAGRAAARPRARRGARASHSPAADASPASPTSAVSWSASSWGISAGLSEPQPASTSAPSAAARSGERDHIGPIRLVAPPGAQRLTGRTGAARRASPAAAPRGSPPGRPRCRTRRGATRPSSACVSSTSQAARGSPSRGWPVEPGLSSHSPAPRSSRSPARRVEPEAGSPSGRWKESATCEWPISETRWPSLRAASRHSSAVRPESTYSQIGSRGEAW